MGIQGGKAMTEHANEVRVGITLTAAGLLLVVGILWLGGFSFGETTGAINVNSELSLRIPLICLPSVVF